MWKNPIKSLFGIEETAKDFSQVEMTLFNPEPDLQEITIGELEDLEEVDGCR